MRRIPFLSRPSSSKNDQEMESDEDELIDSQATANEQTRESHELIYYQAGLKCVEIVAKAETVKTAETSKTAETAKTSKTAETAKTAETSKTPETAKTTETSKTAKTSKTSKTAETAETAKTSKTSKTAETAKTSKTSKTAETAKTSKTSKTAETAETAKTSKTSKTAETAKTSKTAETAETAKTSKTVITPKAVETAEIDSLESCKKHNLKENPSFHPSDAVLAKLASIVYEDVGKISEELNKNNLEDWKLISYGSHHTDGYFGAAFYNAQKNQLVISHQGTNPGPEIWELFISWDIKKTIKNLFTKISRAAKDLSTDGQGVLRGQITSQICSACTYCAIVLRKLGNKRVHITFTGHSLGGWLAEITTFMCEYLHLNDENKFVKRIENPIYHIHTVVFDPPGCYEILSSISNSYYPKYENNVDNKISRLDITTYFNMPNCVNSVNSHLHTSRLLQIYKEDEVIKYSSWLDTFTHDRKRFVDMLTLENSKVLIVSDWPSFSIPGKTNKKAHRGPTSNIFSLETVKILLYSFKNISSEENELNIFISEFNKLFKTNNFDFRITMSNEIIPYKAKSYDGKTRSVSAFSFNELNFLRFWEKFENSNLAKEGLKLDEPIKNLSLPKFQITKEDGKEFIKCEKKEDLEKIVNYVKNLFCNEPGMHDAVKTESGKIPELYVPYYKIYSDNYLEKVPEYNVNFNFTDTIGLDDFLRSDKKIFHLKTKQNTVNEIFRIKKLLPAKESNKQCYLSLVELGKLERHIYVSNIFENEKITIDQYLIIDCLDHGNINTEILERLIGVAQSCSNGKKLILVSNENLVERDNNAWVHKEINSFGPSDFDDSKQNFFNTQINISSFDNKESSLLKFFGEKSVNDFLEKQPNVIEYLLKKDLKIPNLCSENIVNFDAVKIRILKVYEEIEKFRLKRFVEQVEDAEKIFYVVSGGSGHELKNEFKMTVDVIENQDSEDFYEYCREKIEDLKNDDKFKIYWLHLLTDPNLIQIREVFVSDLYINRWFYSQNDLPQLTPESQLMKNENNLIIIADEPGMGKSTTLLNIATNMKNKWIIWISLISVRAEIPTNPNIETIVEFLQISNKNLRDPLIESMLKYSLNKGNLVETPIVLFFDGFDEIDENIARKNMIQVFKFIINKTNAELWITTRDWAKKDLEEAWSAYTIKMKEITDVEQLNLITNIWESRLMCLKEEREQLKIIAEELLDEVENVLVFDRMISKSTQRELKEKVGQILNQIKSDEYSKELNDAFLNYLNQDNLHYKTHSFPSSLSPQTQKAWRKIREIVFYWFYPYSTVIRREESILFLIKYLKEKKKEVDEILNRIKSCPYESIVNPFTILIDQFHVALKKKDRNKNNSFIGIPMQLRMVADIAQPDPALPENRSEKTFKNFHYLYKEFISRKIKIYFMEKLGKKPDRFYEQAQINRHECLGFQLIFPKQFKSYLVPDEILEMKNDENSEEIQILNNIGLVQFESQNKFRFVHYSFAEYFATAKVFKFLEILEKSQWSSEYLEYFIEGQILERIENTTMRRFLNDFLQDTKTSIFQSFKKKNKLQMKRVSRPLLNAIYENNEILAEFLLNSYEFKIDDDDDDKLHHNSKNLNQVCLAAALFAAVESGCSYELIKKIIDVKPRKGFCEIKYKDYPDSDSRFDSDSMILVFFSGEYYVHPTIISIKDHKPYMIGEEEKIVEILTERELLIETENDLETKSNVKMLLKTAIEPLNSFKRFKIIIEKVKDLYREIVSEDEDWRLKLLHQAVLQNRYQFLEYLFKLHLRLELNVDNESYLKLLEEALKETYWNIAALIIAQPDFKLSAVSGEISELIKHHFEDGQIFIISKIFEKSVNGVRDDDFRLIEVVNSRYNDDRDDYCRFKKMNKEFTRDECREYFREKYRRRRKSSTTSIEKSYKLGIEIFKNNCEKVRQLLEIDGINVNVRIARYTLLEIAVINNRSDITEELLKNGEIKKHIDKQFFYCSIFDNKTNNFFSLKYYTPLQYAIFAGFEDIVNILLDHEANVNVAEERTRATALHIAAGVGNKKIVEILIKKESDINAIANLVPNTEFTPILTAAYFGKWDIVKVLLQKKADHSKGKIIVDIHRGTFSNELNEFTKHETVESLAKAAGETGETGILQMLSNPTNNIN